MREPEIREHLKARPFFPFILHVSDGSSCEVAEADHVLVMRSRVVIGLEPDDVGIPTRGVYIDPMHVTRTVQQNGKSSDSERG